MYGDDAVHEHVPQLRQSVNSASQYHHHAPSQTMPRQPRPMHPAQSFPTPFHPASLRHQPPHSRTAPQFDNNSPQNCLEQRQPVYEEISYSSPRLLNSRPARLPPPSIKPPPPPDLESPTSHSCSCSVDSTSIDQELEGIQITPSPKRKSQANPNPSVHNCVTRGTQHKSTQSQESPTESTSSPQDTTNSDCCCECSNGRESGYGTEGRSKSSRNKSSWTSPNLHRKQRGNLKNNKQKQLWVTVKDPESPDKETRLRDFDDNSSLAIFKGDQKSHSTHSMTYV